MTIAPLCIIQARYNSTRLPGKMCLPLPDLGGDPETLIARAWRIACEAFGRENCVVACPATDRETPLADELERIDAVQCWHEGEERDVLGRFLAVARTYRWHPQTVIIRYTPDDPWKRADALQRTAEGVRMPVEFGGEGFTLYQLQRAHDATPMESEAREHITYALFGTVPPLVNSVAYLYDVLGTSVLSIDTREDYEAVYARMLDLQREHFRV